MRSSEPPAPPTTWSCRPSTRARPHSGRASTPSPAAAGPSTPAPPRHAQYYARTPDDPIVFHDLGLAKPGTVNTGTGLPNPQCDNDGDVDDWSTGTPGSNCQDPEASEASMCTNPTQFITSGEGAQPS